MASVLPFPSPTDAQVAAQLRSVCRDFALDGNAEARVMRRFLRTLHSGRSNAVAVMDARRELHGRAVSCDLGGAA